MLNLKELLAADPPRAWWIVVLSSGPWLCSMHKMPLLKPAIHEPRPCENSTFVRNCENCTFWVPYLDSAT